jgi:hypothetical protein
MQDVNVMVVFNDASSEPLALAAAVGAVQGRANIRLRRLRPADDMEYVAPRDADAEWADAILMGADCVTRYPGKLEGMTIETIDGAGGLEGARVQGRRVADRARSVRTKV